MSSRRPKETQNELQEAAGGPKIERHQRVENILDHEAHILIYEKPHDTAFPS